MRTDDQEPALSNARHNAIPRVFEAGFPIVRQEIVTEEYQLKSLCRRLVDQHVMKAPDSARSQALGDNEMVRLGMRSQVSITQVLVNLFQAPEGIDPVLSPSQCLSV